MPRTIKNIVLAHDLGDGAGHVLDVAASLARQINARLTCVHVVEAGVPVVPPGPQVIPAAAAIVEPDMEVIRAQLRSAVTDAGFPGVETEAVFGPRPAWEEILQYVEDHDADMIVVGTHGRTGIRRLFLGSQAEEIVRHAGVPVLTVAIPRSGERDD